MNAYIRKQNLPTRLQQQRKISGYSQKELSKKSKVSLRSIQQYEQRVKDINKASVSNIMSLAIVLGVQVEDIIEYDTSEII